jgi:hypothetical protein
MLEWFPYRITLKKYLTWSEREVYFQQEGTIIDVETAFWHGQLQEEIYMNVTKGVSHYNYEFLRLKRTIYGLVQSARESYKRWLEALKGACAVEIIWPMFAIKREK